MSRPPIVTLLTDFGERDGFVGQMKGAALTVEPGLTLVDLTHEVPPHDVRAASFRLRVCYPAFPAGSIHVAVVDPGVGTSRRGLAVRAGDHLFVAPDNGVLTGVLSAETRIEARVLEAAHLRRPTVSPTFHGRDLFAPAAAWLARGTPLERFGPPAGELVRLPASRDALQAGVDLDVRVLWVDRFGNVTLDVTRAELRPFESDRGLRLRVRAGGAVVEELRETYGDGDGDGPFLVFDSSDQLELALREGRADRYLGLQVGDLISLRIAE